MKILHISDIHGKVENLLFVEKYFLECDLIIVSGDLTHMGDDTAMSKILQYLPLEKTLAVLGNCDYPSALKTLQTAGISIDGELKKIVGYNLCGYGGSLPTPIDTPNMHPEEEFTAVLNTFSRPDILVTHQPAYHTSADLTADNMHVGSHAIRHYIQEEQPKIALCGHMHEAQSVSKVGNTTIVNSGALALGKFAIIQLNSNKINVELK